MTKNRHHHLSNAGLQGMPVPGEQWKVSSLPGPSPTFPEHMWSLILVTKGTSGQRETQLYTKVCVRRTYQERAGQNDPEETNVEAEGLASVQELTPLAGAAGTQHRNRQASGNLINHFLVPSQRAGRTCHYCLSLLCTQVWPLSDQCCPAASRDCRLDCI